MGFVEIVKEWAGVGALLGGAVWGVIKIFPDFRVAKEQANQECQQTEQQKLATEEKELDLDSRRVKASEEVASETLEHLAETREENLKLLENNYELRKAVVDLQFEVKSVKGEIATLKEEKSVIGWFYCGNVECPAREPKLGAFQFSCVSIEMLKKMMDNYGK